MKESTRRAGKGSPFLHLSLHLGGPESLACLGEAVASSLDPLRKEKEGVCSQSIPQGGERGEGKESQTVRGALFSHLPLAESFLVLMILAAYSWPASTFTHLRTTEKAPLGDREDDKGKGGTKSFVPGRCQSSRSCTLLEDLHQGCSSSGLAQLMETQESPRRTTGSGRSLASREMSLSEL